MEDALGSLNEAQRTAVTSPASVLQVLAPPGSGKTKTLTARVAFLLSHNGFLPWNVICCTFTIKASREMRDRLRTLIGSDLESKLILGTFHSICRRYLVTYGYLVGIPKDFGIADSSDTLSILKRIAKRLNLTLDPRVARARISHRKARGQRKPEALNAARKSLEAQEFATIYYEYERELSMSNLLDYDDLLLRCIDLLRAHPECVSNVEAVLVDEFQDTNVVQFELMKLLAWKKRTITIVGDPDQSIYGFRSAEIENLQRMKSAYPETIIINLEENYRSSSAVLRLAQDVIEQDKARPRKSLKATHCCGTLPVMRKLPTATDEAGWLTSEIRRIIAMAGNLLDFSDFAILLRSAHLSRLIEVALGKAGMPYRMVGGHRFYDREEIRTLLDYLRTISQPDNNAALLAVINVPSRKIGEESIKELLRVCDEEAVSLWAVLRKLARGDLNPQKKLTRPAEQNLEKFVGIIVEAKQKMAMMVPETAPQKLLEFVISKIGFREYLQAKHPDDHENRFANVEELLTQAGDLVDRSTMSTDINFDEVLPQIEGIERQQLEGSEEVLSQFLAGISLSADFQASEDGTERQCITISTIHAAKGLEWPVVFVPAVYEGSIPHSRAEDTDEERRLLYVAMTRAQALLYLSVPLRQSRDNVETTFSQFLPSSLGRRFRQVGPEMNEKVVADIAEILRRPHPSQEVIMGNIRIFSNNESASDDVWPPDGSQRRPKYGGHEVARDGGFLAKGSTLAFTSARLLSRSTSFNDGLVTRDRSDSHQISSSRSYSFARDGQQRQLNSGSSVEPSTGLGGDGPSAEKSRAKKMKKKQTEGRIQSHLSAFFASGTVKSGADSGGAGESSIPSSHANHLDQNRIPRDLSHHRINTEASLKRPRSTMEEPECSPTNRYVFLSSSPTREDQRPASRDKSTKSAVTRHITSMDMLQQSAPGRKTLGVRRTFGGWDARKHK